MPAAAVLRGAALGFELGCDLPNAEALVRQVQDAIDRGCLGLDGFGDPVTVVVQVVGVPPPKAGSAHADTLGTQVRERVAGSLPGGFTFPLTDAHEHIQNEASSSRSRVNLLCNADQRDVFGCEVLLQERAKVLHRSREPVELRDEEQMRLPLSK